MYEKQGLDVTQHGRKNIKIILLHRWSSLNSEIKPHSHYNQELSPLRNRLKVWFNFGGFFILLPMLCEEY